MAHFFRKSIIDDYLVTQLIFHCEVLFKDISYFNHWKEVVKMCLPTVFPVLLLWPVPSLPPLPRVPPLLFRTSHWEKRRRWKHHQANHDPWPLRASWENPLSSNLLGTWQFNLESSIMLEPAGSPATWKMSWMTMVCPYLPCFNCG